MSNEHLEQLTDEYVASGLSWHRARAQAHWDLQQLTKAQSKVEDKGEGQTMHSQQVNELKPGGRYSGLPEAKPTITGTPNAQVPRLPETSPWSQPWPEHPAETVDIVSQELTAGDCTVTIATFQ